MTAATRLRGPRHRFVTHAGLELLAAVAGAPPLRYAERARLAVETSAKGRGGNRLRNLRRNFEHTLGINACMTRLATDAERAGHRRPYWWSEAEATRRFPYDGGTRWIRPDAAGVYYLGDQQRPFLFEYDRGTMRLRDYRRKLRGLVGFFASETAEEVYGENLTVLVVSESSQGERRFADAITEAVYEEGILFPALVTMTARVDRRGMLGRIWREPGEQSLQTWLDWTP